MRTEEKHIRMMKLDENIFDGYISEVDDGVWISAIESKKMGNGDFSRLIKQLKEKYNWIKIPTPSNIMRKIAEHLGFIVKSEWFGEPINEIGTVMFWENDLKYVEGGKNDKTGRCFIGSN